MTITQERSLADRPSVDPFLRRAVSARRVYVVAADARIASSPSRLFRGREVALLCSEPEFALCWAAVHNDTASVQEVSLAELLADRLPALGLQRRMVGLDWAGEEAGEPELDPRDLAERLRLEMLESFLSRAVIFGALWTLCDVYGLVQLSSQTSPGHLVLPCWSDERQAASRIDGDWSEAVAMRIRMDDFVTKTLPGLAEVGTLIAPEHMAGPGAIEIDAADLRLRIGARRVTGLV